MRTAGYSAFTSQLQVLAADVGRGAWNRVEQDVHLALNGQAADRLRTLVPLTVRREEGAFFTGGHVKERFTSLLAEPSFEEAEYWDPTCGAGDLLLAAAEHLPVCQTLEETLGLWGALLRGCDLQAPFIEVARLRLFLAAAARHHQLGRPGQIASDTGVQAFKRVRIADGAVALHATRGYRGHLLLNPPYGPVQSEGAHDWSAGSVSQAAVFFLAGARALAVGRRLYAVLPDVLRSGSRYETWRARAEGYVNVNSIELQGQFDAHTDIDVFLFKGERRRKGVVNSPGPLWWQDPPADQRLEDAFEVRVGPVVDNRDPHLGPESPFLTARDLAVVADGGPVPRMRRFAGRLLSPPFVVVRRTSRPGSGTSGGARAAGVLVTGRKPVAVDNHLIAISPRSAAEQDCNELLQVLSSDTVSEWLDQRIRCRHLTVGAVRALPWTGRSEPDGPPESSVV